MPPTQAGAADAEVVAAQIDELRAQISEEEYRMLDYQVSIRGEAHIMPGV
jgi:hypothetical protein